MSQLQSSRDSRMAQRSGRCSNTMQRMRVALRQTDQEDGCSQSCCSHGGEPATKEPRPTRIVFGIQLTKRPSYRMLTNSRCASASRRFTIYFNVHIVSFRRPFTTFLITDYGQSALDKSHCAEPLSGGARFQVYKVNWGEWVSKSIASTIRSTVDISKPY